MGSYAWHQGSFEHAEQVPAGNRAFLYGDGFFETFLSVEGVPSFWAERSERMEAAMRYLHILPDHSLNSVLQSICDLEEVRDNLYCRIRLTCFRAGGGKYTPESTSSTYHLEVEPLPTMPFNQSAPQKVAVAHDPMTYDLGNRHKLIGRHQQVRYALECREREVGDLVILNEHNELCECISGNVLLMLHGQWFTPPLESGCLNGVMRTVLLRSGVVSERNLTSEDMHTAEALASSNSIQGIVPLYFNVEQEQGVLKEVLGEALISSVRDLREILP